MKRSRLAIIAIAIFFACLVQATTAASVTVAPGSGSSAIQTAANLIAGTGGDVVLPAGTYSCSGAINLPAGVNLVGAGAGATTIQFTSSNWINVAGRSQLRAFKVTGAGCILIEGSDVTVDSVTMTVTKAHNGAFFVYAANKVVQNIVFVNCQSIDSGCSGFLNSGEGSTQIIRNIRYTNCRATNSGRYEQFNPWMVGYDLAEAQVDIDGMVVENCIAEGSWEGGFHFEIAPDLTNIVMRNCVSRNNAQRLWEGGEQVDFGQGFLVGENTQVIDCVSEGNYQGFEISGGSSSASTTTLTRCSDINSVFAYRTTDFGYINLYDCSSDRARTWAIYGINSHDVYASNFRVTNPIGNPYPALLLGSSYYPSHNMNVNLATGAAAPTATTTAAPTATTTRAPMATVTSTGSGQAPVAHFRANAIEGTAPFTVQFADTSVNNPTAWLYTFGDGTTSALQNPSHTYTTPGLYTVTLRATNSAGSDDEVYVNYIIVRAGTAAQPTTTPSVTAQLPGTIEAENFDNGGEGTAYHDTTTANLGGAYRQTGVDIEPTSGGYALCYIRSGEWVRYTISVASAGTYTATLRASSWGEGRSVTVKVDDVPAGTVSIPNTGSYDAYTTVGLPVSLPAGTHRVTLHFNADGMNLDRLTVAPGGSATPTDAPTLSSNPSQPGSTGGPGLIQAEQFDEGGEGVAYHDTTPGNLGGAYRSGDVDIEIDSREQSPVVAYIRQGEWLRYTVGIGTAKTYTLTARAANPDGVAKSIRVLVNGRSAGTISIPATQSFETYTTAQAQIALPTGNPQVTLVFDADRLNLNWIQIA